MNHARLLKKLLLMNPAVARISFLNKYLCHNSARRSFSLTACLRNESGDLEVKSSTQGKVERRSMKEMDVFEKLVEETGKRDKDTFVTAIAWYAKKEQVYKRGHVEFIEKALDKMKLFGVHRDLQVYKMLIDLFPKGKLIPHTIWQAEFRHYPKQQFCCIDILEKMSDNGVLPDNDLGELISSAFGTYTHPFRKYRRMMYWMPKMKNANPFPIPAELPDDRAELAQLVMKRMSVDPQNRVQLFQTEDLGTSVDQTFIVSGQSIQQQQLLAEHPKQSPVYVEGAFDVWIRHICMKYFILRSDVTAKYKEFENSQEKNPSYEKTFEFNWNFLEEEPTNVIIPPSVHEQSDGTVLAMCITGTSSRDSLASWIKFLERDNPALAQVPVAFLLRTPETGVAVLDGEKPLVQDLFRSSSS